MNLGWLRLLILVAGMGWPLPGLSAPLLVAHRGASYDAPENTLAAFRLAWDQQADAVEGDFHLTRDGHIVCIHDKTTKRTAGASLVVSRSSLAELRRLDVGSWKDPRWKDERIPTLDQVLATVPAGKRIFVEIKCGPEIVPALKQALARSPLSPDQTIVIAFDAEVVAATKKQIPGIKAYWLTGYKQDAQTGQWTPSIDEILATLKASGADGLDSQAHQSLGPDLLDALRERGYEFHVWTVDDPVLAGRMQEAGALSITTNRPQWLRERLSTFLASP